MASRRGNSSLWTSASSESALGASAAAGVPGPYVAVFIQNIGGGAKTFRVQAAQKVGRSAGVNELGDSEGTNLAWHDVQKRDGSGDLVITTGSGDNSCVDLSPFAPELIRLVSVEGFTAGQIIANVASSTG